MSLFVLPDLLLFEPLILAFCWLLHFSLFSSDVVSFKSLFFPDFLLFLSVVVVVSISRSCSINVLLSNGFTLFIDHSWLVIIISLHLDIWSNNELMSWSFSFNSLWRKRIWLYKWPISLSEWFSGVFAILDCNSSFLKIITSFKKYFFRDSNSAVITDLNFLKQFSTLTWLFNRFCWCFYLIQLGEIDIVSFW